MGMTIHKEMAEQDTDLQYRVIFEGSLEGMEVIDAQTRRVVTVNQAMANIFGFTSPEEMVGLNPLDYIPTEDRDRVARMIDEDMFRDNLRLVIELRAMTRDGREIWLSALGVRIEYQGRPAGLISVRDITAQKLIERKIEASKEETRLLVENAGKAIVVVQDGIIKFANSRVTEITGYSDKEMVSSPFTEFIHPDDQQTVAELYLRSLRGEEIPQGSIVRSIGKEGNVILFGLKAVSFTWDKKPAVWILMNDITERRKAQQELEQSEKKYRQLVEAINEGIWAIDKDSNTTFVSPRMAEILGYTMDEMVGRHLFAFMDERGVEVAKYNLERCQQGIKEQHDFEFVRKDGTWIHARLETLPIVDGRGDYVGTLAVVRDITERKKADKALAESEKRYRFLAENVSDVIWVIDMNLRPTYLSPSITRMTGYSVEETIARGMEKGLDPASIEAISKIVMGELAKKGEPNTATRLTPVAVEIEHKDGSRVWAEAAGTLLRGSDGQPVEIIGILHDITERKKAEETLQRREQRFRALTEHSSDVILIVSAEGTIRYISPSVEPVLGFKPEEAIGTSILEYIQQGTTQLVVDDFARLLQNPGATMQTEIRVQHKDGTWRTLEGTATNLLHDPAVEGIVINYRNITERKKAEEALQRREQYFRALIEHSSDVIAILSAEGKLRYVSASVEPMLGLKPEEATGRSILKSVHPEDIQPVSDNFARLLHNPGAIVQIELRVKDKDGNWRILETTATNLLQDPAVEGIVVNYRDITERKKAEEAIRESEARYRLLAENLSDVIWIMGTDLKYSYISPSVTRQRGYSVEEAMTQPLTENMTPASLETAMRIMVEEDAKEHTGRYDPNRSINMEVEVSCKDGSTVWTENKITYLRDSNGQITGYLGVSRDITERHESRKQLEQSLQKLGRTVDGTVQAIALTVESRDRYTAGHQRRVAQLGCAIAREMGFDL